MNLSVTVFMAFVILTLLITYYVARRVKNDKDFYAAGRAIKGWQNGLAIAGEFMAAAAFLGIPGLIALYGIDAQIYSICWFSSFFVVLVLVAEVVRNSGKYTFADIVTYRLRSDKIRPVIAGTVIIVCLTYLVPQMVAAGALAKMLFGISEIGGILIVGSLMVIYIALGGMVAATWIQSIKAVLLLTCAVLLGVLTLSHFNFSVHDFFAAAANTPGIGQAHLEPGGWLKNPWERYSLGIGLLFGTAAMPHVIMRFYTVPTKKHAQSSGMWTMTFMGIFHMFTFVFGIGAALLVGKEAITAAAASGNTATPMLAQFLGGGVGTIGGDLFLAFVASVAFITIIAAVSGQCIAASSAFSYDIWFKVVKKEQQTQKEQLNTARVAALGIGLVAIILSLGLKNANVAYLSGVAFAIAATVNLPAILFSLYWEKMTTKGAYIGIVGGTIIAVIAVLLSPVVMGEKAIFPLSNPGIITIPLGFILTYVACLMTQPDQEAVKKFKELSVRAHTALGSE